jgi:hypothetical protein
MLLGRVVTRGANNMSKPIHRACLGAGTFNYDYIDFVYFGSLGDAGACTP